jgi:hypothetical protein
MTGHIKQIAGMAHSYSFPGVTGGSGAGCAHEGGLGEPPTQKVPGFSFTCKKTTFQKPLNNQH